MNPLTEIFQNKTKHTFFNRPCKLPSVKIRFNHSPPGDGRKEFGLTKTISPASARRPPPFDEHLVRPRLACPHRRVCGPARRPDALRHRPPSDHTRHLAGCGGVGVGRSAVVGRRQCRRTWVGRGRTGTGNPARWFIRLPSTPCLPPTSSVPHSHGRHHRRRCRLCCRATSRDPT